MAHYSTFHITPEAKTLIDSGVAVLKPKISPAAAELHMLGIHPDSLARLGAANFYARHQAFISTLTQTLTPAICNSYPGCSKNFRQELLTKLHAGKEHIITAFQSPKATALADLVKAIGPFPQPIQFPVIIPPVTSPDLSSITLPPVPAPSSKPTLTTQKVEEPLHQTISEKTPLAPPSGGCASKLATTAKIAAAGLISIFAGMHHYPKHRDALRAKVTPDLLPAYDATETALYGTYRAERSALQALAQALNQAVNGTNK